MFAQTNYSLEIIINKQAKPAKPIQFTNSFTDSVSREQEIDRITQQYLFNGYFELQRDSINYKNKNAKLFLSLNTPYKWASIKTHYTNPALASDHSLDSRFFANSKFSFTQLQQFKETIIRHFENSGYPFASVKLDSIDTKNSKLSAVLIIQEGPFVVFDTIILHGFTDINLHYIQQYTGIKIGDPYQEELIQKLPSVLNRLEFASPGQGSEVIFINQQASLTLFLKPKKTNQLDGIIGFQPNANNSKKMLITGNLRLDLKNVFKRGEKLKMNWESPAKQTQLLTTLIQFPYLLKSPFGASYQFNLEKRDSLYLNIENRPSILFSLHGEDYIAAYAYFYVSNTLGSLPTLSAANNILDFNTKSYGIEANINRLDYPFNPRKGFLINLKSDLGTKNIIKRAELQADFYDQINLSSRRFAFHSKILWYQPIAKRHIIHFANLSAYINSELIVYNELFKIGGNQSLRGFDEQSIPSSMFSISTLEYHYMLDLNSYFGVFYDIARANELSTKHLNTYQAGGLSLSFSTQAGIFKMAYAIGKKDSANIQFKNSKIHFGYTALF
jgi:outer membrane protein assembly factor BamA